MVDMQEGRSMICRNESMSEELKTVNQREKNWKRKFRHMTLRLMSVFVLRNSKFSANMRKA